MKININSYLNKETDVKHKDIVTIASEGGWEQSKAHPFKEDGVTPNNQFNINFKLANGEVRSTTLSFTNVKVIVGAFGDESTEWIGKELRAWKTASEKAKLGYTFFYVPTDWSRDETGAWDIPQDNGIEYPENDLGDIPFE